MRRKKRGTLQFCAIALSSRVSTMEAIMLKQFNSWKFEDIWKIWKIQDLNTMWNIFRLLELCDQYEWDNGGTLRSQFPQQLSTGRPVAATHSAPRAWSQLCLDGNQSVNQQMPVQRIFPDFAKATLWRLLRNFPELSMSWQIFVWRSNKLPSQLQL